MSVRHPLTDEKMYFLAMLLRQVIRSCLKHEDVNVNVCKLQEALVWDVCICGAHLAFYETAKSADRHTVENHTHSIKIKPSAV